MDSKQLKNIFHKLALANGFVRKHSAWFKESTDNIVSLDLQRSYYSNLYYLNIKTFVKGMFGKNHTISKELTQDMGDIFRREPNNFNDVFNLDIEMPDSDREKKLNKLFSDFLIEYVNMMSDKSKIIKEYYSGSNTFGLLPAVRKELGIS